MIKIKSGLTFYDEREREMNAHMLLEAPRRKISLMDRGSYNHLP